MARWSLYSIYRSGRNMRMPAPGCTPIELPEQAYLAAPYGTMENTEHLLGKYLSEGNAPVSSVWKGGSCGRLRSFREKKECYETE